MSLDSLRFWIEPRWKYLLIGMVISLLLVTGLVFREKIGSFFQNKGMVSGTTDVAMPTIVNGELVLPKTVDNLGLPAGQTNLGRGEAAARLGVVSANLVGLFDPSTSFDTAQDKSSGQASKFVGIRIVGEMSNLGGKIVDRFSPLVRFFDKDNKLVGQKVGRNNSTYDFFGVVPAEKTLYDITVDSPPASDRVEIVLNVESATDSAVFDELKIAGRSVEVKTAKYQQSAGTGSGDISSEESVQYYSVSGSVVNTLSDPVSDITIYSWARNKEGKVFALGRQDFKNDLLAAGEKIDFRILLLPLKNGEEYDSYEVAAWGKRYRLNL